MAGMRNHIQPITFVWLQTGFRLAKMLLYGVCFFLNGVIGQIMFCLATLIVCKLVAIPLNPLPKWRYEKSGIEDYNDLLSNLTEIVKNFQKKEGDK